MSTAHENASKPVEKQQTAEVFINHLDEIGRNEGLKEFTIPIWNYQADRPGQRSTAILGGGYFPDAYTYLRNF